MHRISENREAGITIIRVPDRVTQFVVLELAWALGFAAWTRESTHELICVECSKGEAVELLELARPTQKLLKLRKLEVIAEAVLKAGATPSSDLQNTIKAMRAQVERNRDDSEISHWRNVRSDLN